MLGTEIELVIGQNSLQAKVTMSHIGTFETCQRPLKRSACGGRPEVAAGGQNDANDAHAAPDGVVLRRAD